MAALLALGSLALMVGGFWDEVWHRKYGLPFGEDLLWRPHLLIYFGLLLPPALAAVSLVQIITRGEGRLPQRLRADPGMSLLVFLGVFLLLNVPADPIWHLIYGEDISAWSLPHLVLMLSAGLLALLGAALPTLDGREPGDLEARVGPAVDCVVCARLLHVRDVDHGPGADRRFRR